MLVAARLRATLGRFIQRGRRSGAEVADQTEYARLPASEKLAYGHAVLDLQASADSTRWPRSRPWSGMGVGLVAGPGEGGVGLGRKGSDWARFGPRGSREVAFGRAWA